MGAVSILVFSALIVAAWAARSDIHLFLKEHISFALGSAGGFITLVMLLGGISARRKKEAVQAQKKLVYQQAGIGSSDCKILDLKRVRAIGNKTLGPLFSGERGKKLLSLWRDAGWRGDPFSVAFSILITGGLGFGLVFWAIHNLILSYFTSVSGVVLLLCWVVFQAGIHRRQFQDQFPDLLDRLADSLQAGLSLVQAVQFVIPNLPDPSAQEMKLIAEQVRFGIPLQDALEDLYSRRPIEEVRLLVEGVKLHQQVGGNLIDIMRDMADVVRERITLEKEVRTLTAQGRLSAVVITLLVPISLLILAFFPGYIEVLFETTIGNLVLITVVILDAVGALIVRRLIKVEV